MNITGIPLTSRAKLSREEKLKKLKKVSTEFESIFFFELAKSMRKTVPKDSLFGEGIAEDIFKSMLDVEYGRIMAKSNNWGIAEQIYRQLKDKVR